MKYLMKAARRLSTPATPKARPAMPSRSPVAEADQRLNIDAFAARFDVAGIAEPPVAEEEKPAPSDDPEEPRRGDPAVKRPTSPAIGPSQAVIPAVQSMPRLESAPARRGSGHEASERALPQTIVRSPSLRNEPVARDPGPPYFSEKTTSPPHKRTTPEPQARRVGASPEPVTAEPRSPAPDRSPMKTANAETRERAPVRQPAANTMMDALNQALSWIERRDRDRREIEHSERVSHPSSPRSQARLGEMVHARPVRAAPQDNRPITHLEIGKIEVEVVPPGPPPQNAVPRRPGPKTLFAGSTPRQTFGWRQR